MRQIAITALNCINLKEVCIMAMQSPSNKWEVAGYVWQLWKVSISFVCFKALHKEVSWIKEEKECMLKPFCSIGGSKKMHIHFSFIPDHLLLYMKFNSHITNSHFNWKSLNAHKQGHHTNSLSGYVINFHFLDVYTNRNRSERSTIFSLKGLTLKKVQKEKRVQIHLHVYIHTMCILNIFNFHTVK
jgi:hypothetical protein